MIKYGAEEKAMMAEAKKTIVAALMPMKDRVEAAIIVLALIQCARVLIRKYPSKEFERYLVRVCQDYLEGRTTPRDDPTAGLLIES